MKYFSKRQRLQLEGDFYKYFDIYSSEDSAIEALTVLTPDFMQLLLEYAAECDIEFVDNKLHLYWKIDFSHPQKFIQKIFEATDQLMRHLYKKSMNNKHPNNDMQNFGTTAHNTNIKLRKNYFMIEIIKYHTISVIIISFTIFIYVDYMEPKFNLTIDDLYGLIFIIVLVFTGIFITNEKIQRKKLLKAHTKDYTERILGSRTNDKYGIFLFKYMSLINFLTAIIL